MSVRHRLNSSGRIPAVLAAAVRWRILAGVFTLALATIAPASTVIITVGPDGTYSSIQAGVNQAESLPASDEVEVRVEVKLCNDIHGFQYVCPYKENVNVVTAGNIFLHGGWQSDFQTQYADGTNTLVQGTGADAAIISLVSAGGNVNFSRFELSGSGTTSGYNTRGIYAYALSNSIVYVIANNIHDNSLLTGNGNPSGGAGVYTLANGAGAAVSVVANKIQSNAVFGTDSASSSGGGAFLVGISGGKNYFNLNALTNNSVSNPSGGGCHGGGLWASANTGSMQLYGNSYTGNQQFACTNGATGDAAEIDALNASAVNITNESWTNNLAANDPGVYEVFMHAESSANIYAGNGLITHGTWGGLYAQTDATSGIILVNFTIADNPVLGYNGVGPGTQLWNTILWNDGSPYGLSSGATFAFCLYASDPLFIDSASGNYRLSPGSPAINAGYSLVPGGAYDTDLDGSPRPYLGDGLAIPDIGAYEFHVSDTIFSDGFGG